ncbi:hypothetical protein [Levilactobacillus lindianensis]|uniref:hypothetical protein n=1 Tax=Levilactobacillus lindianensis TaxID=2486018 RepID=UPI000F7368AB|nr:hypothetical protein [Levilactobacillus lindianensis]
MQRWLKLTVAAVLGLTVGTSVTVAQAASRVKLPTYPVQRILTFKAKGTPVYRTPKAAASGQHALGQAKSTTKRWTATKVVAVKGKRYVRLALVSAKPLSHGTIVIGSKPASTKLVGGYVALNKLKAHEKITQLKSLQKTAYWTPTTTHDFWSMPAKTLGTTVALHYGSTYGYRTLYAIQSLTTTSKKQYLYLETAAGKAVGWLPAKTLNKGTYPDLINRELTRDLTGTSTTTTTIDKKGHVKVGVAVKDGVVQRVVLLKQNSQTIIYNFKDGRVTTRTTRTATGAVKEVATLTPTDDTNLTFKARANFDIQGIVYQVTVTPAGKVSFVDVGGWMA